MDKIIDAITNLSTDPKNWDQLLNSLKSVEEHLVKNPAAIDHGLVVLNPTHHSLGMCFLLNCKALANVTTPGFLDQVALFIHQADWRQIRRAGSRFANLCRHYSEVLISQRSVTVAVRDLKAALILLRPSVNHVTPLHTQYLKVCILAKMYHQTTVAVDGDVTEIMPGTSARDLVLYFYYAGIALIGLKRFKRAQMFLQMGLSVPTTCTHAMLAESYKKYILVSLIVDGRVPSLSRVLNSMITRQLQVICKPYLDFAQAFNTYDPDQAHAVAAAHGELFVADKNMGLVKQCIQALYRRIIMRITTTFLTLSLADIATKAKLPTPRDAERLVVRMVEAGEIQASIDQPKGWSPSARPPRTSPTPTPPSWLTARSGASSKRCAASAGPTKTCSSPPHADDGVCPRAAGSGTMTR
ncbi:putative COP9 signalosome complex subunit 3 [Paratrimastix pyriformis]|uniref:COP9 signalosome complex subunit 3 n=1 Tax=Paratrimastix pyriformis TaxID=342808 RepID=A0ABQ8ULM5_9EUKA|nr:putative COP9 signalosome complex subunit 3 [Paratrimastix pyriformis]